MRVRTHSWLVAATTVVACSAFAATAVAHLVEATALAESSQRIAPRATPAVAVGANVVADEHRAGDPAARLVARNIFCSGCAPEEPPTDATHATGIPPGQTVATELPLRLVATQVSSREAGSFATIRNTATAKQGAYSVGEEIPGAGRVTRIASAFVEFQNASNRTERVPLFQGTPSPAKAIPVPPRSAPAPRDGGKGQPFDPSLDASVRKLGDTAFEIDRALVTKLLASPSGLGRGVRVVPSSKDGRPDGFTLRRVRPSSVYARLGLQTGDTIHAVNGLELTSMDKALDVFTKLRESSNLSVSITRGGKPLTMNYTIR